MARLVSEEEKARPLRAGDPAPAFTLPAYGGARVSSVDRLRSGPLVVTYRGLWCPYCQRDLSGLAEAMGVWPDTLVQRCTVHKHRNLLAHAPERLHEEISADYTDMIYAETPKEIETRRKSFLRKWRLKCRAVADSLEEAGEQLFAFTRLARQPVEIGTDDQRHRAAARGVQAPHQDPNRAALGRDRRHAVLGPACLRSDHHAQGRRLANTCRAAARSMH